MPLKIKNLRELQPFLNISNIAKAAGIRHKTILSKLTRGTKLDEDEVEYLSKELNRIADLIKSFI